MANNYFNIEGLHIEQELCAMKVGTDSVLFGRWAANRISSETVLDIGCGTGILALMVAKLTVAEKILAIDIDEGAHAQTLINIQNNGMQSRVEAQRISLQELVSVYSEYSEKSENCERYDYILCNPPYFKNSLKCIDAQRNIARHNDSLSFKDLMQCSARLLNPGGRIAIIMPTEAKTEIDMEAAFAGFTTLVEEPIQTSKNKPIRRWIVEYSIADNR